MDLRMRKIESVYNVLKNLVEDDGYTFFYDRREENIVSIDSDLLEDEDVEFVDDEEASLLEEILTDIEGRYIKIEPINDITYFDIACGFVNNSTKLEFKDGFEKIKNSKKFDAKFMELLDKYDLLEEYDDYEDLAFVRCAERFLMDNHIITRVATSKNLRRAYETADQFATLELWKKFKDADVIELNVDDKYKLYYSIMGNAGKVTGVSIYVGDFGLNSLAFTALAPMYGIDDLFAISFERCIKIFYDNVEDVCKEDIEFVNSIGYKHVSNYVTTINICEPGYLLSTEIDDDKCSMVVHALEMLMSGLSSIPEDFDVDKHTLRINVKEDAVTTEAIDKIILSYYPDYELETKRDADSYACTIDHTYEMNLSIIEQPVMSDGNVSPLWAYNLIIMDRDSKKIMNILDRTNEGGDVIELLQFDLMEFFEDNEIGNNIIVNNPILEAMLAPYADMCAITIDEPSELMQALVDEIQEMAKEKEFVN